MVSLDEMVFKDSIFLGVRSHMNSDNVIGVVDNISRVEIVAKSSRKIGNINKLTSSKRVTIRN